MKDFFKPTFAKIILGTTLFVFLVPFIRVERVIYCFIAPCPQYTFQSILLSLYKNSVFLGINWIALVIGLALNYLATCAIFTLSKKEFIIALIAALLQFGSVFLISDIIVGETVEENYIITIVMVVLAICGFMFSGKRKRTLVFTLILPLIYLLSIL